MSGRGARTASGGLARAHHRAGAPRRTGGDLTPGRLCRFPSAALTGLRLEGRAARSEEGQGAGRGAAASPSLPLCLPCRTRRRAARAPGLFKRSRKLIFLKCELLI